MKFQAPNPKIQIILNDRNLKQLKPGSFENWNSGFIWDLDIGIWDLSSAIIKIMVMIIMEKDLL